MTPPLMATEEGQDRLSDYLDRIGLNGTVRVDLETLRSMHRHHVEAVTWENLDMHLGVTLSVDPLSAFEKIVDRRRGGWCYEMNGLFAWMLELAGFQVTRLAAGVARDRIGEMAVGNHLALIVQLDQPYLADVGLGSGLIEPVPLAPGAFEQCGRKFFLEQMVDGWWRFHNHPDSAPPTFDFHLDVTDESLLRDRCHWLQTDPASPFWGLPIVQRYRSGQLHSLIGTNFSRHGPRLESVSIADANDYAARLSRDFGLTIPDNNRIWQVAISGRPANDAVVQDQLSKPPKRPHSSTKGPLA